MRWFPLLSVLIPVSMIALLAAAPCLPPAFFPPTSAASPVVTFHEHVAPILFKRCAPCHRPDGCGPFSLLAYQEARKRASQIAAITTARLMPPWRAESSGEFLNECRLSTDEIQTLSQWARTGAAAGNPTKAPPAPIFPSGWQLGTPHRIMQPDQEFRIPAEGADFYRNFPLVMSEDEDRWIDAMEIRPSNPRVVHHVILYLDLKGVSKALDARDSGPGYATQGGIGFRADAFLAGWMAGTDALRMPEGVGMRLPKDATLVLQVHYHPSGRVETDRTSLGLHFIEEPPERKLRFAAVLNPWIRIPAGESRYRAGSILPVLRDATLYSVTPHMHLLGQRMDVSAVFPDGQRKLLLRVPKWDFRWQPTYTYRKPVRLPKGTRIVMDALFDNSMGNPNNPHRPPREVRWGDDSKAEMCMAFLAFTSDAEQLREGIEPPSAIPEFGVKTPEISIIERRKSTSKSERLLSP